MKDLLWVFIIAIDILVIADVTKKLTGKIERFLWIVAIIALPVIGAGLWIGVQYAVPRNKRLARQRRKRMRK